MDFHAGGGRCGAGVHAPINSRPSGSHHYLETRRLARAPRSQILRFMNGAAILEIRKRARQMRTDRARRFHNWGTNAAKNTPNRREKYHSPRARARTRTCVLCAPVLYVCPVILFNVVRSVPLRALKLSIYFICRWM